MPFLVAFAIWVGLPLLILGRLRVFWSFPKITAVLYGVGLLLLGTLLFGVFVAPAGSTAALAIISVPFLLNSAYAATAVVLKLKKAASGAKCED